MKDNVFYYSHIKKCGGIFLILLFIFSVTEDGVQDVRGTSALHRPKRSGDLELWVQGLFRNKDKDLGIKPKSLSLLRKMGLEPTRFFKHKILSLACLPVPALPHIEPLYKIMVPLYNYIFFI